MLYLYCSGFAENRVLSWHWVFWPRSLIYFTFAGCSFLSTQLWTDRFFFTSVPLKTETSAGLSMGLLLHWWIVALTMLNIVQWILFAICLVIFHILAEHSLFPLRWLTAAPLIVLQEHLLMNELADDVSVCWLFVSVYVTGWCMCAMQIGGILQMHNRYYCARTADGVGAVVFLNMCADECQPWVIPLVKLSWEFISEDKHGSTNFSTPPLSQLFRVLLNILFLFAAHKNMHQGGKICSNSVFGETKKKWF